MPERPTETSEGVIAKCNLDYLGVVSDQKKVVEGDGERDLDEGFRIDDCSASAWQSQCSEPIGRVEDLKRAFDALYDQHCVPDYLLLYAVRYALGAESYAKAEIVTYLWRNWEDIAPAVRRQVQQEIREWKNSDRPLGSKETQQRWLQILHLDLP